MSAAIRLLRLLLLAAILSLAADARAAQPGLPAVTPPGQTPRPEFCQGEFLPVSPALNDLGPNEYIRIAGGPQGVLSGPTGFSGGLYPGGSNTRPANHTAAGMQMAGLVVPRSADGSPDPSGKIGLIGIGMSNTAMEFENFRDRSQADPDVNPKLVVINAAQGGKVASYWADPQDPAWDFLDMIVPHLELTDQQVQVAFIKLTNFYLDDFPQAQYQLQSDLETILRLLKVKFPNLHLAYLSSRIRAYAYWEGGNPEPGAFETGFAVRWLLGKQISGDASLNYDPGRGAVVAPYVSWGPYLWADGLNPRSDGLVWLQTDLNWDCLHPSQDGRAKVGGMLLDFFKSEVTAQGWFLSDPPPVNPPLLRVYIPKVIYDYVVDPTPNPVRQPGSPPLKR